MTSDQRSGRIWLAELLADERARKQHGNHEDTIEKYSIENNPNLDSLAS